jgi:hypothetical protein
MLSEFSPIPGTPDGEQCRQWIDLDEPLCHNKTVFTAGYLGFAETNRLKLLCRQLNSTCTSAAHGFFPFGSSQVKPVNLREKKGLTFGAGQ